jgi:hypothetical protein
MNNTSDIEDIKDEITRWAATKTPQLYEHFSAYLGIEKKEVKNLFASSKEIQNHIDQYFQEERAQELAERGAQLTTDLVVLNDLICSAVANRQVLTVEKIAKATGIARCNVRAYAEGNPEVWAKATGAQALEDLYAERREKRKLKEERKAATEALHAENRRLKAERTAIHEAKTLAKAERKKLKAELIEKLARDNSIALERKSPTAQPPEPFSSYAVCDYAYERGRLVKKLYFKISLLELRKIGYTEHINLFFDGIDCFGIYVHDHDHLGNYPSRKGPDFHIFCFTWHKKMCEEPRTNKMVPIKFNLVETTYKNGLCFMLPEPFFMSYISD